MTPMPQELSPNNIQNLSSSAENSTQITTKNAETRIVSSKNVANDRVSSPEVPAAIVDDDSKSSEMVIEDEQLPTSGFNTNLLQPLRLFDDALLSNDMTTSTQQQLHQLETEYAKLQDALRKAHESEQRFKTQCRTFIKQIKVNTHKLTAMQVLQEQDVQRRKIFTDDIEKMQLQHSELMQQNDALDESIKTLRSELDRIQKQSDANATSRAEQRTIIVAQRERELAQLTETRDKDRIALMKVRAHNVANFKQLTELQAQASKSQSELDSIQTKILEKRALSNKEQLHKAELERTLKDMQQNVNDRQQQLQSRKNLIEKGEKDLRDVLEQLEKSKQLMMQHNHEFDELGETARSLAESLQKTQFENKRSQETLHKTAQLLEMERAQGRDAKRDAAKKLAMIDILRLKIKEISAETQNVEANKSKSESLLKTLKENITALQFKMNMNSKAIDTCMRERDMLAQNHTLKIDAIKAKELLLKIGSIQLKNLRNEHESYLQSIRALVKRIDDMHIEKQGLEADLARRQAQKARALQQVSERELSIGDYQRQMDENENELRKSANLLEQVTSDRNRYRKELIEKKNEMHELKRKLHFLSSSVHQLKSEIADKDNAIVVEHFNLQNMTEDIQQLQNHNTASLDASDSADATISDQSKQIRKLQVIISDADNELRQQIKQYNQIVNEQRVLNQQLIQRNEELAKLYEELNLQTSLLAKSSNHFNERQKVLNELLMTKQALDAGMEDVMNDIRRFNELKMSVQYAEDDLLSEQMKVKTLSDELEKPMNVHRWRRLMDINSDTYAMIKKVRVLQKQLIKRQDDVDEKDADIQDKEQLYIDLRRVLARQPGTETLEQIKLYRRDLKDKKSKLRAMDAQLELYRSKVGEFNFDIKKLDQDMQLIKLAYFQRRRKQNAGKNIDSPRSALSDTVYAEERNTFLDHDDDDDDD